MPFACSGSFSRRWKISASSGSSATSCLPSSLTTWLSAICATRFATESTSTVFGSSPSSPSSTARSLPCPLPVKPRLPNSSTFTLAVSASWPSVSSRSANRFAARIGPTVCELDGPMPILKMSKTLMCTDLQHTPHHELLREPLVERVRRRRPRRRRDQRTVLRHHQIAGCEHPRDRRLVLPRVDDIPLVEPET